MVRCTLGASGLLGPRSRGKEPPVVSREYICLTWATWRCLSFVSISPLSKHLGNEQHFMSPSNLPCAYHQLSKEATQGIICFLHLAASTANLGDVSGFEQIRGLEHFLVRHSVLLCSGQERLHVLHQQERRSLQEVFWTLDPPIHIIYSYDSLSQQEDSPFPWTSWHSLAGFCSSAYRGRPRSWAPQQSLPQARVPPSPLRSSQGSPSPVQVSLGPSLLVWNKQVVRWVAQNFRPFHQLWLGRHDRLISEPFFTTVSTGRFPSIRLFARR